MLYAAVIAGAYCAMHAWLFCVRLPISRRPVPILTIRRPEDE